MTVASSLRRWPDKMTPVNDRSERSVASDGLALEAGCRLIAEGVETEDEARALRALGVEFGQGYLFGHPGPAADWTAARAAAPEPSQLPLPQAPDGPSTRSSG